MQHITAEQLEYLREAHRDGGYFASTTNRFLGALLAQYDADRETVKEQAERLVALERDFDSALNEQQTVFALHRELAKQKQRCERLRTNLEALCVVIETGAIMSLTNNPGCVQRARAALAETEE